jgi:hypothetical protein
MPPEGEITQDVLDEILKGAIEDLRQSGIGDRDIFLIVKEQFDSQNAHRVCGVGVGGREAHSNRLQRR